MPDALAINACYLQQAQGGRHVLLIGDKKGHNCGFSIRKSSNVKPTAYLGKAVLLSYEVSTPKRSYHQTTTTGTQTLCLHT